MAAAPDRTREHLSNRIVRALGLARERVATADLLNFYADLCEFQQSLLANVSAVIGEGRRFVDALDAEAAASLVPEFVAWLDGRPQRGLTAVTDAVRDKSASEWEPLLQRYWQHGSAPDHGLDEIEQFVAEAFLQPFAETLSRARNTSDDGELDERADLTTIGRCRVCGGRASIATLRERGHGARRSLVCGFCLAEWPIPRAVCVSCGEHDADALLVYRAEEFPDIRIDACRSCESYIKTIDFTRNGAALPVVDDLASLAMDLWAAGRGYRKLRPNLLRL